MPQSEKKESMSFLFDLHFIDTYLKSKKQFASF